MAESNGCANALRSVTRGAAVSTCDADNAKDVEELGVESGTGDKCVAIFSDCTLLARFKERLRCRRSHLSAHAQLARSHRCAGWHTRAHTLTCWPASRQHILLRGCYFS